MPSCCIHPQPHMERQVGQAQPPGGGAKKIGKQLARRLQSIITLLSVGYNSVPLKRQYHVE